MEKSIIVNSVSCIKCGKCIKVCPSILFSQNSETSLVEIESIDGCISCGHCVASCPTDSVQHSDFPSEKVHAINYSTMPTPEQMLLLCKARRSNRAFSSKQIPSEMLDLILEAAHAAPTASNMQQIEFTLVTSPDKLRQITDFTIGVFGSIVSRLENPFLKPFLRRVMPGVYKYIPAFNRLIAEREKGRDMILRGATAVLFIHAPKKNRFGCMDANLAYQNGSLMAESLGVSQFYTGFVCSAIQQDKQNKLAEILGIEGTIHAGMALGLPQFRFPKYIDKNDIKVNKI